MPACTQCVALLAILSGAPSSPADPVQAAHDRKDPTHLLTVVKVDSAIETMNKGTVDVFGARREYRCPTGELVAETACAPCSYKMKDWGEPPAGIWVYDMSWDSTKERSQVEALARLDHFRQYFELEQRTGSEKGTRLHTFFEFTGRMKPPPEAAKAIRVRFLVGGREATAAVIPAGARTVEIDARAQRKGETGSLEEYPEAVLSFAADCGESEPAPKPGAVLFALNPGVERCELRATAEPGGATATIGVRREVTLEITYEGQAADQILVDGQDFVELAVRAQAAGRPVSASPEWTAPGARLEKLEESGSRVKVSLPKGLAEAEVKVLDAVSGAGDSLLVRRKQ